MRRKTSVLLLVVALLTILGLAHSEPASAGTVTPFTAFVKCNSVALQLPSSAPHALQGWTLFNGGTKSVWVGTSSSVTAGPNSVFGWVASNGGVWTSQLQTPSKVWCVTISGTNGLALWGEYGT